MRVCTKCEKEKDEKEFTNKSRRWWCKDCNSSYDKERYRRIGKDNWRRTRGTSKKERRRWLLKYKSNLKCSQCPESHPSCIDFHHIDPKHKLGTISELVSSGRSVKVILKEISKCIILCANCHRKLHWNESHEQ